MMDRTHHADEAARFPGLPPTETTHLLSNVFPQASDDTAKPWTEDAWMLAQNASPLVVSGLLQHSLGLTTIFQVGHLGQSSLAAVSLATMTANVTGYATYQGMATALDTLCAQAFGSRNELHVGLYFQQMVLFLWILTVPIGALWYNADEILEAMVPDKEIALLTGRYLRILLWGAPGYAAFEAGKKFVQAQGIFHASTYILLFVAPLNALMNWFLVWKMELGFIGAPISSAITNTLLPLLLLLYVRFVDGSKCWNGLTTKAFSNWGMMFKLALPGFFMLEAEFLAFEILTLAASHLSNSQLAAQSILSPLIALTFQAPFALAVVASTTIASLIGAGSAARARAFGKVAVWGAFLVGLVNFIFMVFLGAAAAHFLTNEEAVIRHVVKALPVIATFQHFDALATTLNGFLRGLGKQAVGSIISIACYYCVAIPISFITAFWLKWELVGLWSGIAVGLALHSLLVGAYLFRFRWESAVEAARDRHAKTIL